MLYLLNSIPCNFVMSSRPAAQCTSHTKSWIVTNHKFFSVLMVKRWKTAQKDLPAKSGRTLQGRKNATNPVTGEFVGSDVVVVALYLHTKPNWQQCQVELVLFYELSPCFRKQRHVNRRRNNSFVWTLIAFDGGRVMEDKQLPIAKM